METFSHTSIETTVRSTTLCEKKWSLQIAEAVAYTHEKGIIHSNLSTTNVLVCQAGETTDLILADFSRCVELDLDGDLAPDDPFLDPQLTEFKSPKADVFSLGILIYIIMTSHYPFHEGLGPPASERFLYGDRVRELFDHGEFPDLSSVPFGDVIAGCCCERRFETAKEVVEALELEMQHLSWRKTFTPILARVTMVDCTVFLGWII